MVASRQAMMALLMSSIILMSCSKDDDDDGGKKGKVSPTTPSQVQPQSIYGSDDRRDWYQVSDPVMREWARSTVALISKRDVFDRWGSSAITSSTYQRARNLCSDQPFLDQPTAAYCSGFYVGQNLIVTAGHCVSSQSECDNTVFVFDYAVQQPGVYPLNVANDQVFGCKRLVSQKYGAHDYALIEVDRDVSGRIPFQIRRQGQPAIGENLTMIGHPAGLPSKISDGGAVMSVSDRIVADVDAFGGNSGSAVIDRSTGIVEGILVSGNKDYDSNGRCVMEHKCGADCDGEKIYAISNIANLIPPLDSTLQVLSPR